jgi:hypothetical protein
LEDQVLTGDHPVRLDEDKVPCGVVCSNGLPQWLWIVDALGFKPVWCLLLTAIDLEWLRPAYPKIVFTIDIQYCPRVSAVFSDARPLEAAFKWDEMQLQFSLKKARRTPAGWNCSGDYLRHSAVGGCTDERKTSFVFPVPVQMF